MKFLYIDIKKGKLVGVFNNVAGNIKYLTHDEIIVQKEKHQAMNRINTVKEFDDAIIAMENHDSPEKWYNVNNKFKRLFKK